MMIANTETEAQYPWPDGMLVQGGGTGVVFDPDGGAYRTAFVEAFPGGTFLRGEGPTLAEAETECWAKYVQYTSCDHGPFERRQYRNGAGFCTKCGMWMSRVFDPLPEDPDRKKRSAERLLERLFVEQDDDALNTVLHTMAHADELPTKDEMN